MAREPSLAVSPRWGIGYTAPSYPGAEKQNTDWDDSSATLVKTKAVVKAALTMPTRSCIMVSMNRLPQAKRVQVVKALVEGNSIRATDEKIGRAHV